MVVGDVTTGGGVGGVGGVLTTKLVVPVDGAKVDAPEYFAVTVSIPTGAVEDVHEPTPSTSAPEVHIVVAPIAKVTVPGGLPPDEVTSAQKMTGLERPVETGVTVRTVVVVKRVWTIKVGPTADPVFSAVSVAKTCGVYVPPVKFAGTVQTKV